MLGIGGERGVLGYSVIGEGEYCCNVFVIRVIKG